MPGVYVVLPKPVKPGSAIITAARQRDKYKKMSPPVLPRDLPRVSRTREDVPSFTPQVTLQETNSTNYLSPTRTIGSKARLQRVAYLLLPQAKLEPAICPDCLNVVVRTDGSYPRDLPYRFWYTCYTCKLRWPTSQHRQPTAKPAQDG